MIIDSHQHVWDPGHVSYEWLGPHLAPIDRTISMDEIEPTLARLGVSHTVLVQSADNREDTEYMLAIARTSPRIVGVVGYVPLHDPAVAADQLTELLADASIVGIRNLIHDRPDPDWLLTPAVDEGLSLLEEHGVPFDVVAVLPRHLEIVPIISERHPRLRMVIDHLGKPPVGRPDAGAWAERIRIAAENPNVFAKVSGLYSATTDLGAWTVDQVRPHVDHAFDVFDASRLMYGGDWPISMLAGGYEAVWTGLTTLFAELSDAQRDQVQWRTACSFYGLDVSLA